jgi:hypothetical protein
MTGLARYEDQQQQHIAIRRCMVLMSALMPWMFTACLVLEVVAYRLDVWRYGRLFAHCTRFLSSVCEGDVVFLRDGLFVTVFVACLLREGWLACLFVCWLVVLARTGSPAAGFRTPAGVRVTFLCLLKEK